MNEDRIVDAIGNVHRQARDKLTSPEERQAYDDGVLAAGQYLDDERMPKGSKTSFGGKDILTCVAQMLEAGELTEAEAEMVLKKYRHKLTPAGQEILINYRVARRSLLKCQQPEPLPTTK